MAITFKDRVSENPNRRKLTVVSSTNGEIQIADEIVVDVERDEGTITEQGTLFAASNMNTLMVADAVIRNQNEFDALVGQFHATIGSSDPAVIAACPKTIVLVGGGGNGANGAYTVPLNGINLPWVKTGYFHLQGINGAKLYWDCTGIEGERAAVNGGVDNWADTNCTFKIENIRIDIIGGSGYIYRSGFYQCVNLKNCFISSTTRTKAFNACENLINCYAIVTAVNTLYAFIDSKNLINCIGLVICSTANMTSNYSFYGCENLTNCTGTGTNTGMNGKSYGFYDCENLTNCTGKGTVTNGASGYGFYDCENLTNCTGTGTGTGTTGESYGFYDCENLTNCTGTGTVDSVLNNGSGFYKCERASNCKDGGSTNSMWYGTNKAIDPVTCKKTPATADNSALNS